ncbi:tetratricopeptide repeat protein [Gaetbulibacter sp. M235]|uniref:tetratricopeptide repeat protein n=1 Tax=Gaetbulibacter sp. M235 TaxID=3126510 RepID=UPI00374E8527
MRFIFIILVFVSVNVFSQDDIFAKDYFENGEYEKALVEYKKLYAKSPTNTIYIFQLINTYQQLEKYDDAEQFLTKLLEKNNYPAFLVELGYNYQLKNNLEKANEYYSKALASLDINVNNVFNVARSFQSHSLLNETLAAYEKASTLKPDLNFNLQMAQIYGEQGDIEKMFNSYIDFVQNNEVALNNIKRAINDFISEDASNENNVLLKKIILKKDQQEPNVLWNDMLSWLFIQQREFGKAFIQEKAIFNRKPESLLRIVELYGIAMNEGDDEVAKEILNYLINTAQDLETLISAHYNLLQIETKESLAKDYQKINSEYLALFNEFGTFSQTLDLQIAYAHFLAFYLNQTEQATTFLEKSLNLPINDLQKAQIKLELGDIYVLKEEFNTALLYYTQIQRSLKNSTISQEARFKVAKTSYYKGDFNWAESQLKILKASTSQLIANDALDLKLIISDNKYEDSLHVALKLFAKADLMSFQNKNDEAISLLDTILKNHKTESIVPQALYKQAKLFEKKKEYVKAEANYSNILTNYKDGILVDDASFALANLYSTYLSEPEKAKALYEDIVFNHADSIYFIEARKKYRALRGDAIN